MSSVTRLIELGVTPTADERSTQELLELGLPDPVLGMAAQLLNYISSSGTLDCITYEEGKGVGFAIGMRLAEQLGADDEEALRKLYGQAAERRRGAMRRGK